MRIIIALDVTCNKRRYRLNKLILGYGERVQHSIFEVDVSLKQLKKLQIQCEKLICSTEDRINFYPLCGKCMGNRKADGMGRVSWPERFYVY